MRLPDHRHGDLEISTTIRFGADEDLDKLRLNVLSHVLGFQYRSSWWDNERWDELIAVLPSHRDAAERALAPWVLPDGRGVVTKVDLQAALSGSADVRAIVDQVVPLYRAVIAGTAPGWIVDYHWPRSRRYRLMDHRAVVLAGTEVRGSVHFRTCFRSAKLGEWCGNRTDAERVRSCHQMQVGSRHGVPIWHDRWEP